MADTKISALSAAAALDGTEEVPVVQSGGTVRATVENIQTQGRSFVYQAVDRTLTNTTASQKLFDQTTNGRLTLTAGLYEFDMLAYLTTMSATAGNAEFSVVGAGTAVATPLLQAVGIDNNAPLGTGARTGAGSVSGNMPMATPGTGSGLLSRISGVLRVTTGGTLIPSVALDNAAAAVVKAGTYLVIRRLAGAGVFASGDFD